MKQKIKINYAHAFGASLLCATILPLLLILTYTVNADSTFLWIAIVVMAAIGGSHVPSTVLLFFDKDIRKLCKSKLLTFIVIPILFIIVSYLLFLQNNVFFINMYILFFVSYQVWHYGKQNLGILSITASSLLRSPLPKLFRLNIYLGMLLGLIGTASLLKPDSSGVEFFTFEWNDRYEYFINCATRGTQVLSIICFIFFVIACVSIQYLKIFFF